MNANPILEEIWRIKDELAREANYDLHQLCENTRQWADAHPRTGPVVRNAEELRQWMDKAKQQQTGSLALKEEPPKPDKH